MKIRFRRHLFLLRLRRYHCAHNSHNILPIIRRANLKWYGLNSVKNTLLRSSTLLFQSVPFLDSFLIGIFSKTIFYKKLNVRLGKKYVKISNSLPIASLSDSLLTSKSLLKMGLSIELINAHSVESGRVKIIFDLKNVLLGLFKANSSTRETNINKLILVFKLRLLNIRELEVLNFVRIFNSVIRESAS
jgi:hypothetical protein